MVALEAPMGTAFKIVFFIAFSFNGADVSAPAGEAYVAAIQEQARGMCEAAEPRGQVIPQQGKLGVDEALQRGSRPLAAIVFVCVIPSLPPTSAKPAPQAYKRPA
jgi:hypothetical protein